jgi:beta-hydroxylase
MSLTLADILTTLSSPRMIVLWIIVASAIAVHYRGRERLRFVRQLTDHSTFMAPYNILAYLFSAVPNQPYLDVTQLPDLAPLRDNWRTIREEALNLYDQDRIKRSEKYHDLAFNSFFRSGWKRFYLKWYGAHHASAQELCPKTVELLEKIPTVKAAMFAMLPPGAKLGRHRDPFAGSLRYHLGLVTPNSDDCRIYVDGKMYSWRDGEAVLFDETSFTGRKTRRRRRASSSSATSSDHCTPASREQPTASSGAPSSLLQRPRTSLARKSAC